MSGTEGSEAHCVLMMWTLFALGLVGVVSTLLIKAARIKRKMKTGEGFSSEEWTKQMSKNTAADHFSDYTLHNAFYNNRSVSSLSTVNKWNHNCMDT